MSVKPSAAVIVAGVIAFVAILAAYVVLSMTGHASDAAGIVGIVATLLGLLGLGAHTTNRLTKQDEQLGRQSEQLSTISHQTNGVLTERIERGADTALRRVLREAGYNVPDAQPAETAAPPDVEGPGL